MQIILKQSEIDKIEKLRESLGFSLKDTIIYLIRLSLEKEQYAKKNKTEG